MSANRAREHLLVLPEDDANKDVINAFLLEFDSASQVELLRYERDKSGLGWKPVMKQFKKECLPRMLKSSKCHVLLLIDFDNWGDQRLTAAVELTGIAEHPELRDRLFILGSSSNAEGLRKATGHKLDKLGSLFAEESREDREGLWGHDLLKHNRDEVERLRPIIRRILL